MIIDEKNMIPMHEYISRKKWEDKNFVALFDLHMGGLHKDKNEREVLKTAFNMYYVGFMDINVKERIHDKRVGDPYKKALSKISELFLEIKSLSPEPDITNPETEEKQREIIEYIEGSINFYTTTRTTWKKIFKGQAVQHLEDHNFKQYRHKNIFTAFHRLIAEEE